MAEEGHVGWVASEQSDVLLYPVEGCYLVHEAVVGYASLEVWGRVGVKETWKKVYAVNLI